MEYKEELILLKSITKEIFKKTLNQEFKTTVKGEQDIVTTTDLFIEKELSDKILEKFPNDSFHTEEYNNDTLLKNRTWIIDPIDGTSNYASGLDLFVLQIALFDKGDIVLSYIYLPAFDKEYYAIKGEGSYLNDKRYQMSDISHPNSFLVSMVGLTHKTPDKTYYHRLIDLGIKHKYKVRMLGSIGLEMALTSEGVFDLFYSNVTNIWDLYPGILLIKEAGGILLNEKGLPYNLGDLNLFVIKEKTTKKILEDSVFITK